MDGAFVTVIILSLVGTFENPSFFGMVRAGKNAETCLFLHAFHKLSIDEDCLMSLLACMSIVNTLFRSIPIRIMRAIIAHLLECSRSSHSRYHILLILHGLGYPAIKGVLVEVSLHLADHGS